MKSISRTGRLAAVWIACGLAGPAAEPLSAAAPDLPVAAQPSAEDDVFRITFTRSMFSTVNVTDAEAAIKTWIELMVRDDGRRVRADCQVVTSAAELRAILRNHETDAVVAPTAEFLEVEPEVPLSPLLIGIWNDVDREEFLLLARRDRTRRAVSDLRDGRTIVWTSHRTSLADDWLRVLRAEHGLNGVPHPFGSISRSTNLSSVALPVFFGQAEACVVTQLGWETLTELNPQLGAQLEPLARSEGIVSVVVALRADYQSPTRATVLDGLRDMDHNPAGRQVLMLFHGDGLHEAPSSVLDSARALRRAASALPALDGSAEEQGSTATTGLQP